MEFLKKNIKWIILVIILMIIVSGVSVYATTTYFASQIIYKDGQSVADALNDLYTKANNKSNKKTIFLTCGSYDKTGNAIQCNISGNENTVKKITIKNIEYLRSGAFQIGYKIIGNANEVSFNTINIGDTFDINNQSYSISFYGTAGQTYGAIKMELEIEY